MYILYLLHLRQQKKMGSPRKSLGSSIAAIAKSIAFHQWLARLESDDGEDIQI